MNEKKHLKSKQSQNIANQQQSKQTTKQFQLPKLQQQPLSKQQSQLNIEVKLCSFKNPLFVKSSKSKNTKQTNMLYRKRIQKFNVNERKESNNNNREQQQQNNMSLNLQFLSNLNQPSSKRKSNQTLLKKNNPNQSIQLEKKNKTQSIKISTNKKIQQSQSLFHWQKQMEEELLQQNVNNKAQSFSSLNFEHHLSNKIGSSSSFSRSLKKTSLNKFLIKAYSVEEQQVKQSKRTKYKYIYNKKNSLKRTKTQHQQKGNTKNEKMDTLYTINIKNTLNRYNLNQVSKNGSKMLDNLKMVQRMLNLKPSSELNRETLRQKFKSHKSYLRVHAWERKNQSMVKPKSVNTYENVKNKKWMPSRN